MQKSKSCVLDVMAAGMLALLFGGFAAVNFLVGQIPGGVLLALLALLCAWMVVSDLRRGVRPPSHYEWFRLWMLARPVLVVVLGITALLVVLNTDLLPKSNLVGGLIAGAGLVWAGLVFYLIWQTPHRHEADAAYKQRIGYREKRSNGG